MERVFKVTSPNTSQLISSKCNDGTTPRISAWNLLSLNHQLADSLETEPTNQTSKTFPGVVEEKNNLQITQGGPELPLKGLQSTRQSLEITSTFTHLVQTNLNFTLTSIDFSCVCLQADRTVPELQHPVGPGRHERHQAVV